MAEATTNDTNLITVPGTADFPHLFEKDQKSGNYSMTVLFDKTDPAAQNMMKELNAKLNAAIERGIAGQSGRDGKVYAPFSGRSVSDADWMRTLTLPVEDGDTARFQGGKNAGRLKKDVNPEFAGHWLLKTKTNNDLVAAGYVVDTQRRPLARAELYAGALVRVNVWFYPYANDKTGVGAQLQAVVKTGDGERLTSGASDPLAGFDLPAADGASNPLGNMGI